MRDPTLRPIVLAGRALALLAALACAACPGPVADADDDDVVGESDPLWTDLAVGGWIACAVRVGGELACWGSDPEEGWDPDRPPTPAGLFQQTDVAAHVPCGLALDGGLSCTGWGVMASPPAGTFEQFSLESHTGCGVASDGSLVCWGDSLTGVLEPPTTGDWVEVSVGGNDNGMMGESHACALDTDGGVACWGSNGWGQASPPGDRFVQVSANYEHTCAIAEEDGSVVCWGRDQRGQASPPDGGFVDIAAGYRFTCGIRTDGSLDCWGSNQHHDDSVPGPIEPPDGAFVQVSADVGYACGIRADGPIVCWGSNIFGADLPPGD